MNPWFLERFRLEMGQDGNWTDEAAKEARIITRLTSTRLPTLHRCRPSDQKASLFRHNSTIRQNA